MFCFLAAPDCFALLSVQEGSQTAGPWPRDSTQIEVQNVQP
jgi:hypothetical protein